MKRLKLVNLLKCTFLGSEFYTFAIMFTKLLLLPEMHRFFTQLVFMTSSRRLRI